MTRVTTDECRCASCNVGVVNRLATGQLYLAYILFVNFQLCLLHFVFVVSPFVRILGNGVCSMCLTVCAVRQFAVGRVSVRVCLRGGGEELFAFLLFVYYLMFA